MTEGRPVVKKKLNGWYDSLVNHIPKQIKNVASKAFLRVKKSILRLYDSAKKTLKGDVESETEKANQIENVDLIPHEHERVLKGTCRSLVVPVAPKIDIDSCFDQTKSHIKTLIKNEVKEMGSAKVIMSL